MSESPTRGKPKKTLLTGPSSTARSEERLGADATRPSRGAAATPGDSPEPEVTLPAERSVHELRITLENDLGELAQVCELAHELLGRHGPGERVVYAADLALEEILSNVIRHGYQDEDRHEIALLLRVGAGGVEIEVEDDGREFDPTRAPDAELDGPLAERRVGGLGIHLLRAFVREISYERRGERNILRLRI